MLPMTVTPAYSQLQQAPREQHGFIDAACLRRNTDLRISSMFPVNYRGERELVRDRGDADLGSRKSRMRRRNHRTSIGLKPVIGTETACCCAAAAIGVSSAPLSVTSRPRTSRMPSLPPQISSTSANSIPSCWAVAVLSKSPKAIKGNPKSRILSRIFPIAQIGVPIHGFHTSDH